MNYPESLDQHRRSFLEAMRVRSFAPATIIARGQWLSVFFNYLIRIGVDDVRSVDRPVILAFVSWLHQEGYSTSTIHAKIITLRRFFEYLEATESILINPTGNIQLPRMERRLPKQVITPAMALKILESPDVQTKKGLRDKAILELFYSTGLRLEEMTRLTLHDVDCKNGFVRVHYGKGRKDRMVPMGAKAAAYLLEYLCEVRAVWTQGHRDERALWLCAIDPHGVMKKQAIGAMAMDYARSCGVTEGRAHLWRHACATHLVSQGSNISYVQRLLGHKSLETTQIYTRVTIPELKKAHPKCHPRGRSKKEAPSIPSRIRAL